MRSAVFITPESLFNRQRADNHGSADPKIPAFRIATQALRALRRLKDAGYVIIGLAGEDSFRGFASPNSCREFLAASALDDVIISPRAADAEDTSSALIQAAGKWLLDLDRSFIIGRTESISNAGLTGCTPLRITNKTQRPVQHDLNAFNLVNAVDRILSFDVTAGKPSPA